MMSKFIGPLTTETGYKMYFDLNEVLWVEYHFDSRQLKVRFKNGEFQEAKIRQKEWDVLVDLLDASP